MVNETKIKSIRVTICYLLFALISISHISQANASSPMDKLSDIQNKIKSKIQQVKEARMKESSLTSKIENINKNIDSKEKELKEYNKRISGSRSEINALQSNIKQQETKLARRTRYLNERIRALHKRQYGGDALVLMTAADNQDLIKRSKYISLLAYYDRKIIKKYSSRIREINAKKRDIEAINEKLTANKNIARKKKDNLQSAREKQDRMYAMVKRKRLAQETKIKELKESSKKLQNMVRKLKARKIPDSIIGSGFKASKGELSWPVNGNVLIPYGEYKDPKIDATVFKNGVEIDAKEGDNPKAVAGGRVVYAKYFEGYGNLLIIDHGSGYNSLYGNLSEITMKTGELLIAGMEVGKADRSKNLNVPALYFEIRYKGKPVNPLPWLK
jgi:septal ring factor EnvC (AmiA/AmiB activator)